MISTLLRSSIIALCLVAMPLVAIADDQARAAERLNELFAQMMEGN